MNTLNDAFSDMSLKTNVIQLTKDSWISITENAVSYTKEDLEDLFSRVPTVHAEVMMGGKSIPIPRFQKLYGSNTYSFSGKTFIPDPDVPELVKKCIAVAQKESPKFIWNTSLVNWYLNGSHYIGPHSDDERSLDPGSSIYSFSFGASRIFRISGRNFAYKTDIETSNNQMIVMHGSMQKEFKHEIVKTKKFKGPRFSITLRSYITD